MAMNIPDLNQALVSDILDQWPQTAPIFQQYEMACIGCALSPFCTISQAAAEYGIPPEELIMALWLVIESPSTPSPAQ